MSTLYSISSDTLTGLADAVRGLTGTSAPLSPDDMIDGIEGHVCPSPTIQSLSVTQNGEYIAPSGVDGYSPVTVNVSGGGGASNVVSGTFKGTEVGVLDIDVPYTGNGYAVAVIVFASEGYSNNTGSFYTKVQRHAILYYTNIKNNAYTQPTQGATSGAANQYSGYGTYKNSTTSASSSTSTGISNTVQYSGADPEQSLAKSVRIKNSKKLSVYIAESNYGFAKDIDYSYVILYSE